MSSFCSHCGSGSGDSLAGTNENLISGFVDEDDIVPDVAVDVIDVTVPAGKAITATSVQLRCRQPGVVVVTLTPSVGSPRTIASGLVGVGGNLNFDFKWFPFVRINAGDNVKVGFTIHDWAASSDVEAFLQNGIEDA